MMRRTQTNTLSSHTMRTRTLLFTLAALSAVALSAGCATKADVRSLQEQMLAMQARQDSLLAEMKREEAETRSKITDEVVALGGMIRHNQQTTEERLARLETMTGYAQREVAQVQQQIRAGLEQIRTQASAPATTPAVTVAADTEATVAAPAPAPSRAGCPATKDAAPILEATRELVRRRIPATTTAREGALEYIRCFADEPGIAEARLLLAETYVLDRDTDQAVARFGDVVRLSPKTAFAATALYRMGTIEADRGNKSEARRHLQRILDEFPSSAEARLATEALDRL